MRYFAGEPSNLGSVAALPQKTFSALVEEVFENVVPLHTTRAAYHELPRKEQDQIKRVRYVTPCSFNETPAARRTENAGRCNLIFLDIDNSVDAQRLLDEGWVGIAELAYCVWHTASSTPEKPRLRVCVAAAGIPPTRYGAAVRTVAEMLGLANITTESRVCVQPMYLPVQFEDEADAASPIFEKNTLGEPLDMSRVGEADGETPTQEKEDHPDDGTVLDMAFLKTPLEGMTPEIAKEALSFLDPDCSMQEWIEIGAGLKHQFAEEGFEIWDEWSSKGVKYAEASDDIRYRWDSLKANPADRAPVTMRSITKMAAGRGWTNPTLAQNNSRALNDWITLSGASTEELIDQGPQKIAAIASTLGNLQRRGLMNTLKKEIGKRGVAISVADIGREVKKLERETAKTSVPTWARGICFITSTNQFYRHTNDRRFSPEVLDLVYATVPAGDDKPTRPREYLMQILQVPTVEGIRYDPAQANKRFIYDAQVPFVNTYRGPGLASDPETKNQAGDILQEHVANLIVEPEYQRTLLDFLAYHVQCPGKKVRWAVLLQGAMGCGKTALAVAMRAVLGGRNVRKLAASNVLEGAHNDWAYGSQLVVMEEVRVVGTNRHTVMDKLKPCISDDEISIRAMYEPPRTCPNITNYMMFTNHHDSLAVHDTDRRYFVLASKLQEPGDMIALGGEKYFNRLFSMIETMPGGLRAFLEDYKISPTFSPEGRAPVTPYLRELASASASPLQAAIRQAIEDQNHPLVRKDLVSTTALREVIDMAGLMQFSDQAMAGVLREMSYLREGRYLLDDGARHQLWSKAFTSRVSARENANLRIEYL